jgi:uncharacterized RDD family membrane protein YckC
MQTEQDFYAAPQATLQADHGGMIQGYGAGAMLASRWTRLGARMLDGLIYFVIAIPLIVGILLIDSNDTMAIGAIAIGLSGILGLGVAGVNIYMLYDRGQTLGRKALGIRIVRGDLRTKVDIFRLFFLRFLPVYLAGLIPFIGSLAQLGNYLIIFGADQRCGHDYIADTHVIVDTGYMDEVTGPTDDYSGLGF